MELMAEAKRVNEVLVDLTYPAEKWEVITCAEIRGADIETRRKLYGLPARTFGNVGEVVEAL